MSGAAAGIASRTRSKRRADDISTVTTTATKKGKKKTMPTQGETIAAAYAAREHTKAEKKIDAGMAATRGACRALDDQLNLVERSLTLRDKMAEWKKVDALLAAFEAIAESTEELVAAHTPDGGELDAAADGTTTRVRLDECLSHTRIISGKGEAARQKYDTVNDHVTRCEAEMAPKKKIVTLRSPSAPIPLGPLALVHRVTDKNLWSGFIYEYCGVAAIVNIRTALGKRHVQLPEPNWVYLKKRDYLDHKFDQRFMDKMLVSYADDTKELAAHKAMTRTGDARSNYLGIASLLRNSLRGSHAMRWTRQRYVDPPTTVVVDPPTDPDVDLICDAFAVMDADDGGGGDAIKHRPLLGLFLAISSLSGMKVEKGCPNHLQLLVEATGRGIGAMEKSGAIIRSTVNPNGEEKRSGGGDAAQDGDTWYALVRGGKTKNKRIVRSIHAYCDIHGYCWFLYHPECSEECAPKKKKDAITAAAGDDGGVVDEGEDGVVAAAAAAVAGEGLIDVNALQDYAEEEDD